MVEVEIYVIMICPLSSPIFALELGAQNTSDKSQKEHILSEKQLEIDLCLCGDLLEKPLGSPTITIFFC